MILIYNLFYLLCFVFITPWFLFQVIIKKKYRISFLNRLGFLPNHLRWYPGCPPCVWIHGSSVGEILAGAPLIEKFKEENPDLKIVVSAMTDTGYMMAESKVKGIWGVFQFPLDFPWVIRRTIQHLKPELILILETELWPNLIRIAHDAQIKVAIVNGRLSDRSFPKYKKISFFLRSILDKIPLYCMQTENDADRIIQLGADSQNTHVLGNIKYDQPVELQSKDSFETEILQGMAWDGSDPIWVAGSTHAGEESIIINVWNRLLEIEPRLHLILVPRHLERLGDVCSMISETRHGYCLRSNLKDKKSNESDVLIVDTMGELTRFYSIATMAFVGGSLVNIGGHNILEPASYGVAVLHGKFMQNFRDIAAQLVSVRGSIMVDDENDLFASMINLLRNDDERIEIGRRGRLLVESNRGAIKKHLSLIKTLVPDFKLIGPSKRSEPVPPFNQEWNVKNLQLSVRRYAFLVPILNVISGFYSSIMGIRNALYDRDILKVKIAKHPVISVGNLSTGGTGKTPMTILIAEWLSELGKDPAIISRGYGGKLGKVPSLVDPHGSYKDWGDEPLLLASWLKSIPVIVAHDRFSGTKFGCNLLKCKSFVLDDGYQHRKLKRDINILIWDSRFSINHQEVIPAGFLRESISGFNRADIVVLSHFDQSVLQDQDFQLISELGGNLPIFTASHICRGVYPVHGFGEDFLDFSGKKVGLISGIGSPENFKNTVESMGGAVCWEMRCKDHYAFREKDWTFALERTIEAGGCCLLTTAKDERKLPRKEYPIPIGVVDIGMVIDQEIQLKRLLEKCFDRRFKSD